MPVKSSKSTKKAAKKVVKKTVKVNTLKGGKSTPSKKTVTKTAKTAKTAKNTKATKTTKATKATKTAVETTVKKTRSFKVLLPNSEVYEGRFTGLTPYQAANKALSKYYRENSKAKKNIRFSIKESTRGSKRLVYHYNGHREKLAVPVEYAIKSGDETKVITKNYKNKLVKIKKAELAALNLA
jgi:hypothetical protein